MRTVAQALRRDRPNGPEARAVTGLDPHQTFRRARSGWSDTGETVTTDLALQVSAVVSCVRLLAETESSLPLHVWRTDPGGRGRRNADDDPRVAVLWWPNEHLTDVEFRAWARAKIALEGNAYSFSDRDRNGRIATLDPINAHVQVKGKAATGVRYHVSQPGGSYVRTSTGYSSEEILHLRGMSVDGITGLSVIQSAATTVGIGRAIQRANGGFFRQGMVPGGFFRTEQTLEDGAFERLEEQIEDVLSGAANMHRPALLEGGVTYEAVQIKPADLLLLDQWKASVQDIARIFRVHPSLIYVDAGGNLTYDNPEKTMLVHLVTNARPALTLLEAQWFKAMFGRGDRGRYQIRHQLEDLTRADALARAQRIAALRGASILTANEGREWEGLDPVDDVAADSLTMPLNLRPIGPDAPKDPAAAEPADPATAAGAGGKASAPAAVQRQRDLVEAIQKIYLGVGKVVTVDEARTILNTYGAELPPAPDSLTGGTQ